MVLSAVGHVHLAPQLHPVFIFIWFRCSVQTPALHCPWREREIFLGNLYWPSFNLNSPAEGGSLCCCMRALTQLALVFQKKKRYISIYLYIYIKSASNRWNKAFKRSSAPNYDLLLPGCLFFMETSEFNLKDVFFFPSFRQLRQLHWS